VTQGKEDALVNHYLPASETETSPVATSTAGQILLLSDNNCDGVEKVNNLIKKIVAEPVAGNSAAENSVADNSAVESYVADNSAAENSFADNSAAENSVAVDSAGEEAVRFKRLKLSHRSYHSHDEAAAADSPGEVARVVVTDEDVDMKAVTVGPPEPEVGKAKMFFFPVPVVP
jgi:hypothetical protein